MSFDPVAWLGLVDDICDVFDQDMLKTLRVAHRESIELVFIVGLPRSGTTLVEQILSSHSAVFGAGELPDMGAISEDLMKRSPGVPFPQCVEGVAPEVLVGLGNHYMDRISQGVEKRAHFFCDKAPQNFLFIGLMHLLFPNVRVVHCRRDPMDTMLSCYINDYNSGQEFTYSLDNLCHYYGGYQRLMDHWHRVSGIPILDVEYASMVSDQERQTRRVLNFLGLPWEDQCLEFQNTARAVATASNWQVRQPIYQSSVGRWRHYEKHLQSLKQQLSTLYGVYSE